MQNPMPKSRQSSIYVHKNGLLVNYHSFIFFAEILHTFSTKQYLQESVWDFFILFRS